MIAEAGAAIGSIKVAMDIAKGVASLKSEAEINQAIIDIQRALLEAQASALDDKQKIASLLDELANFREKFAGREKWEAEKSRYALFETPVGTYTYRLTDESKGDEISHQLCAKCFEDGKRSILQATRSLQGAKYVKCMVCDQELQLTPSIPRSTPQVRTRSWMA